MSAATLPKRNPQSHESQAENCAKWIELSRQYPTPTSRCSPNSQRNPAAPQLPTTASPTPRSALFHAKTAQGDHPFSLPMKLKQLETGDFVSLADTPVVLGRSRDLGISSPKVSRQHCSVQVDRTQGGGQDIVLRAHRKVHIQRKQDDYQKFTTLDAGAVCSVNLGDRFFLSLEEGGLKNGFEVTVASGNSLTAHTGQEEPCTKSPPKAVVRDEVDNLGSIFQDCHFVFWLKSHVRLLMDKVKTFGGDIDATVGNQTTHIVVGLGMDQQEAREKLKKDGFDTDKAEKVPMFVLPEFISMSVGGGAKLDEVRFKPWVGDFWHANEMREGGPGQSQVAGTGEGATGWVPSSEGDSADDREGVGLLSNQERKTGDHSDGPCQQNKRLKTSGDLTATSTSMTGHQWGDNGNWVECYNEQAAKETVNKLLVHWQHLRRFKGAEIMQTTQLCAAEWRQPDSDASSDDGGCFLDGGGVTDQEASCSHVACAAQPFCILDPLYKSKDAYMGKEDQFRVKAIDRAVRLLENVDMPLRNPGDVEQLKLGEKTTKKILEILTTGTLRRNEAIKNDETRSALSLFRNVWGAGQATAQKWYKAGCRTLDDVLERDDVTERQMIGLKYFKDFQQKIPRKEVEQIFSIVRGIILEVTAALMNDDPQNVEGKWYCRTMGSYLRGKPMTGDVDILMAPPHCQNPPQPSRILYGTLKRLQEEGFIAEDLIMHRPGKNEQSSWMGVCKSPRSSWHRRIDIKVYPREVLTFAANYFTGSEYFCRALRYWCNTPTEETAARVKQLSSTATAFKLSDRGMWLVVRRPRQNEADDGLEPVGPCLDCNCETDIFTLLGLSYVPPHMRYFHNFN